MYGELERNQCTLIDGCFGSCLLTPRQRQGLFGLE